jgi:hypothetical protein
LPDSHSGQDDRARACQCPLLDKHVTCDRVGICPSHIRLNRCPKYKRPGCKAAFHGAKL